MSTGGKRETTTTKEGRKKEVTRETEETVAQKFYRMSGCKTKVEFAQRIGFHEIATRLYLARADRKSRKPCNPSTLHKWAKALSKSGGPDIVIGLWPDGDITLQGSEE